MGLLCLPHLVDSSVVKIIFCECFSNLTPLSSSSSLMSLVSSRWPWVVFVELLRVSSTSTASLLRVSYAGTLRCRFISTERLNSSTEMRAVFDAGRFHGSLV